MRSRKAKKMGQVFLMNREVAIAEAAHAYGKTVLEMGPGKGMLTEELCRNAKKVIAVEKDLQLYEYLMGILRYKNLKLIHSDFFDVGKEDLELEDVDIMISNVPYNASSMVIKWLYENNMEAVLCLQKEFIEHMLANEDTHNYSKLSVMTHLSFSVTEIMNVDRKDFRPIPRVDSKLIYLKPKANRIGKREEEVIGMLMQHKKKTVRNALLDSHRYLGTDKKELDKIAQGLESKDKRPFKLSPKEILLLSKEIIKKL